jgi:WD40 repeat protein
MDFAFTPNPEKIQKESRLVYSFETTKDPQGINFYTSEMPWSRKTLRLNRFQSYSSYKNLNKSLELSQVTISDKCNFFEFKKNTPIPCEFSHFQLRNNVKVVNSELIYLKSKPNTLSKYNPVTNMMESLITPNFAAVSFDVLDDHVVLGGMEGELMYLESNSIIFSKVLSEEDSKITNSVKIFQEDSYKRLLVCNNDHHIRVIDPETQRDLQIFKMDACVNNASLSSNKNLIAACLDLEFDFILDRRTETVVAKCEGHSDYGFSVDWDPSNDFELATGNQDQSVMIWDMRKCSQPLSVFYCYLGSGLKVEYSKNGKYLAFAESADFLTIIDKKNLKERQFLDFFGEISGFGFDESDQENLRIYLGMADPTFYSLIELHENSQTKFMI